MAKKKRSRKTRSQKAEEKRQKRVRMWMGVFIIGIMVLSTFAFVLVFYAPGPSSGQNPGYPGLDYRIENNRLLVDVGDQEIPFYGFPDQSIVIPEQAVTLLQEAGLVIITFDPQDTRNAQFIELVRWDLGRYIDAQAGGSMLSESDTYNLPIGGCEQATVRTPVIKITNSTFGVTVNNSCITMGGQQQVLLTLRDQLLYAYYDVI